MDKNKKENGKFNEKEWYKEKIIEMVKQIENERYIKMIYGYTKSAYEEEKSRG